MTRWYPVPLVNIISIVRYLTVVVLTRIKKEKEPLMRIVYKAGESRASLKVV
jgi:hypothetical protein